MIEEGWFAAAKVIELGFRKAAAAWGFVAAMAAAAGLAAVVG